jgi:uncharacterized RDD family membrane protein YckC
MSSDSQDEPSSVTKIAGFWRRIGALVIDTVILAVPASILGFLFYDKLAALGSKGRLIGLIAALAYFALMNSKLFNGQTIGKRILGLKVINYYGMPISLARSFLRALILTTPFFLNGVLFGTADPNPSKPIMVLYSIDLLVVFGGMCSIIYLYLFNRKTGQSLHDLLVGTFVVTVSGSSTIRARTASIHKIIVSVLCIAAAAGPSIVLEIASKNISALLSSPEAGVWASLQSMPEVMDAQVYFQSYSMNGGPENKIFLVRVRLREKPDTFEKEATRIAMQVLQQPAVLDGKPLSISLVYGFDVGLASWSSGYNDTRSAEDWKTGK